MLLVAIFVWARLWIVTGLSILRLNRHAHEHDPSRTFEVRHWDPNTSDLDTSREHGVWNPASHAKQDRRAWTETADHWNATKQNHTETLATQFCGCNSSSCMVDSVQAKAKFNDALILIFGCSLDVRAIGFLCSVAQGVTMESIVNSAPFSYLAHCTVGGVTVAYVFHPGASPAPYSANYNPFVLGSTRDILSRSQHDVVAKFGREPTAIVVDASLWDVSNWWGKIGRPPYPYPVALSFPYLEQWCNADVPQLLQDIETIFPHSKIAFRTAPTIFAGQDGTGQDPQIIEKMVNCVEYQKNPFGFLYGKWSLIDYHYFVDNLLQSAGAAGPQYYSDGLHPGAQLSLIYMNNVLNWAQQITASR